MESTVYVLKLILWWIVIGFAFGLAIAVFVAMVVNFWKVFVKKKELPKDFYDHEDLIK